MRRSKARDIGRPRKSLDADRVAELCTQGVSWRAIARDLGSGIGTVRGAAQEHSRKNSVAAGPLLVEASAEIPMDVICML